MSGWRTLLASLSVLLLVLVGYPVQAAMPECAAPARTSHCPLPCCIRKISAPAACCAALPVAKCGSCVCDRTVVSASAPVERENKVREMVALPAAVALAVLPPVGEVRAARPTATVESPIDQTYLREFGRAPPRLASGSPLSTCLG